VSARVWTRGAWAGLAVVVALSLLLIGLGFGSHPHAIVDFGRELYVAWRVQAGDVLGVDLAYFNGPLSPHWNALWFDWLGPSLDTLRGVNTALSLSLVILLFHLCLRAADAFSATLAGLVVAGAFAFTQIDAIGNDSYLVPYSHEMLHGLLLLLVGIWGAAAEGLRARYRAVIAGLALGALFLTKPEIFVAGLAASTIGIGALARRFPHERASILTGFVVGTGVFPLAALTMLVAIASRPSLGAVLGAWRFVADTQLTGLPFYQATLGTAAFAANLALALAIALLWGTAIALLLGLAALVERLARGPRRVALVGIGLLCFGLPVLLGVTWIDSLRALPVILGVIVAATAVAVRREAQDERAALRLVLSVAGLALLAKIVLRVQLVQYGFALAMLGCVVSLLWVTHWLPEALGKRLPQARSVLRAAGSGFVVAALLTLLALSQGHREARSTEIGSAGDRFLAGREGPAIAAILLQLEERMAPGETLAVVPEGVMINYLLRVPNPTGQLNLMPPELVMFSEQSIIDAYEEDPPDWILQLPRDTREYGFAAFGDGYAQELARHLERRYEPEPTPGLPKGVQLMRRLTGSGQSKKRK